MRYPRRYINSPPKMPSQFRVGIMGPHMSGKHTQAKLLSEKYGWPIIEVETVMEKVVALQKLWEEHVPNNPESGNIHITGPNFESFMNGGAIGGAEFTGILLHQMGIPVIKKPPPPPEVVSGDEEEADTNTLENSKNT
jgi:hypothetical protein